MTMQMTMSPTARSIESKLSIRGYLITGLVGIFLLLAAVILWGFLTTIDSSVISTGSLRSYVKPQSIRHADGGNVARINVKNGDRAQAGDVLLVLDSTTIEAGLSILNRQIADLIVANYRLKVERSTVAEFGSPTFEYAETVPASETNLIESGQRALFEARLENRNKQIAALDTRINQIDAQNDGKRQLIATRDRQRQSSQDQLDKLVKLEEDGLATASSVLNQRQATEDINGSLQELENTIVENESRKAELDANKARIRIEWYERAEQQLSENEVRLAELMQRQLVETSRLSRVEMRAPVSGTIHKLAANTVGGVVSPAEEVMQIIPSVTDLLVEAQIAPKDIDQVYVGQDASVRFSAFSARDTPELDAKIQTVSADVYVDQQRGISYYVAEIAIPEAEMDKLSAYELVPGMPVEVYVRLGERAPITYLIKPFTDNFRKVFREE